MTDETNAVAVEETPAEPKLAEAEVIRAATNSPELSRTEFKLGDKTYKVIDLEYDDYLLFVSLLSPILDVFISKITSKPNISVPGINVPVEQVSVASIIKYSAQNLPEMVRLICKATTPDITVEEIKKQGRSPFKLATIVLLQIMQNNIIQDFADFFVQIAPLIRAR